MAKKKRVFVCQICGYETLKWQGKCPNCGEWDTFFEVEKERGREKDEFEPARVLKYGDIEEDGSFRFSSGIEELDRVLGGGVVSGSVILIGGSPGAGKSTLLLQMAFNVSNSKKVLYVSGEESLSQIKMRGRRLGEKEGDNLFLVSTTTFEKVEKAVSDVKPDVLIVDSIQTIHSKNFTSISGTPVQINYCTRRLVEFSKENKCATFIVGHITKSGIIAGPKILEHLVDVVLYFEENRSGLLNTTRILRAVKNRFGAVNEVGIFEMGEGGLKSISDPSKIFTSSHANISSGVSFFCTIEGVRPIVVEVQALVSLGTFSNARRMSTTYDKNRISLLLATLEKSTGLNLIPADVYLNIAGGISINETGADLSVVASIVSSFKKRPIERDSIFLGEVGLSGNLRNIPMLRERILEAKKLGFKRAFIPDVKLSVDGIKIVKLKNLSELVEIL